MLAMSAEDISQANPDSHAATETAAVTPTMGPPKLTHATWEEKEQQQQPQQEPTPKSHPQGQPLAPEPPTSPAAAAVETTPGVQGAPAPVGEQIAPVPTAAPAATVAAGGAVEKQPALTKEQFKYCATVLKGLKRHPQSSPFQLPVDPVALNIPDYFEIIKNPIDLSTIAKKMDAGEYKEPEEFIADVKLMLTNCFTYNHAESQVSKMGHALEKYFNTAIAKMPQELSSTPSADDKKRREVVPVTTPRGRREAQPTRRAPVVTPSTPRGRARPQSNPELAFCGTVLRELLKKSHQALAWPFLEPVDPIKLGIPDYFDVIKEPMDLSTVKKKLESGQYQNSDQFEEDVRLIFRNCYTYNAPDSDVVSLCRAFEKLFESKWAQKPASFAHSMASSMDDFDSDSEKILEINRKIQALQNELNSLLMKRRNRSIPDAAPSGGAGSVSGAARPRKPSGVPKSKTGSAAVAPVTEEEFLSKPMSFEEKRQLSIEVNNLAPEKLGRVVEIIQSGMPRLEAQGDSEVIELDIESLDVRTLRHLQKYVMECKGITSLAAILDGGSGGVKRKKPPTPAGAAGNASAPKKPTTPAPYPPSGNGAAPTSAAAAATAAAQVMSSDDGSSDEDLD